MVHALITLVSGAALTAATADLGASLEPNRYLAVSGTGTLIQGEARVTNLGPDDAPSVVLMLSVATPQAVPAPMRSQDVRCAQERDEALRCLLETVAANGPPKIIRFEFHGHPGVTVTAEVSGAVTDGTPGNDAAQGTVFEAPRAADSGGCRLGGKDGRTGLWAAVLGLALGLGWRRPARRPRP